MIAPHMASSLSSSESLYHKHCDTEILMKLVKHFPHRFVRISNFSLIVPDLAVLSSKIAESTAIAGEVRENLFFTSFLPQFNLCFVENLDGNHSLRTLGTKDSFKDLRINVIISAT